MVHPIKLKLGMLDHMNNTFRNTFVRLSVDVTLTLSRRRPICSANQWTGFYMITAAAHERVKSPGLWYKLDLDSILGKRD